MASWWLPQGQAPEATGVLEAGSLWQESKRASKLGASFRSELPLAPSKRRLTGLRLGRDRTATLEVQGGVHRHWHGAWRASQCPLESPWPTSQLSSAGGLGLSSKQAWTEMAVELTLTWQLPLPAQMSL